MHGKTSTSNDKRLRTEGEGGMACGMQCLPDDSVAIRAVLLSSLAFDIRLRPDEEAPCLPIMTIRAERSRGYLLQP